MSKESRGTTKPGFVNPNGQIVVRDTGLPGTTTCSGFISSAAACVDTSMELTAPTSTTGNILLARRANLDCRLKGTVWHIPSTSKKMAASFASQILTLQSYSSTRYTRSNFRKAPLSARLVRGPCSFLRMLPAGPFTRADGVKMPKLLISRSSLKHRPSQSKAFSDAAGNFHSPVRNRD